MTDWERSPTRGAPQGSIAPAGAGVDKLRVFITYSREDLDFADQLAAGLELCGFEASLDREGISGGEAWEQRLGAMIREADTIVFVLSPASAQSKICEWEVGEAERLNKRVIPVNCRPLDGAEPPRRLRHLNYIFFYAEPKAPGSGFGAGLARLVHALNTDLDWLREHTRLLQRATEWQAGGRPANRLLSGADVAEAKAWAARRPKDAPQPAALHLDFIKASEVAEIARGDAARRQIEEIAQAQDERAKALQAAEEANRKRFRLRVIAFAALAAVALIAVWQAWLAEGQRREAVAATQMAKAEAQRAEAEAKRAEGEAKRAEAQSLRARQQFELVNIFYGHITQLSNAPRPEAIGTKELFERTKAAAERGNTKAANMLGLLHIYGQGVPRDQAKAFEWFERSAIAGDPSGMTNVGILYVNGQGVRRDYTIARQWYEKAASVGHAPAMTGMGFLYANGQGVELDYAIARRWYEKAAAESDPAAMTQIGFLYANGQGVERDHAVARQWYEKAIAAGDASAMTNIGILYANGDGVPQDFAQALAWYEKAAAAGNTVGMTEVAMLHADGRGVPQDYAKARAWYEKAAAAGDSFAMSAIARLYAGGQGVERDYGQAVAWYEKAAAAGDIYAMTEIANLYAYGPGLPRDFGKAREWYKKAIDAGDTFVATSLLDVDRLEQRHAIQQAADAGRHAEALQLQEKLTAWEEANEAPAVGKAGAGLQTARALHDLSWRAVLAGEHSKALTAVERALQLAPKLLHGEIKRAHALMFLGRSEEARAIYLAPEDAPTPVKGAGPMPRVKPRQQVIAEDFAEFRKAGLSHPLMAEIETALGRQPR